jgi:hypothetical protein
MRLDLDLSYPHCPFTAAPSYVGVEIAEGVAISARQQMGLEDGSRLALDLDLLMSVEAVRVNGVAYNLHWHVGGPLTDENGEPVLGICEHDPDGIPDAALISINPDVVGGREEVILSTAVHEKGHVCFEAPKWILDTQRVTAPGLPGLSPHGPKRVHRTITPDENHLAATPPRGSPEFFEEVRANAFMGAFLAPIHRVYARLCHHCERLGLSPSDLQCFDPAMLSKRFECIAAAAAISRDHLRIIDRRLRAVDELLTRLARDFGVTKRFIEVRLRRYGFLGQAKAAT